MGFAKPHRLGAVLAILTTVAVTVSQPATAGKVIPLPKSAIALLRRSLDRTFLVNIRAIITQRDPRVDGGFQRVRIERSREGRVHCTILQPLRVQGVESVDDGNRYRVFLPDQKMLIDQDSVLKSTEDTDARMALAAKNYTFRMGNRARIAGRITSCIVATPRHESLDARRYFIDQQTFYPLRLETIDADGESRIYFDTKDIQYPDEIEASSFAMRPAGAVTTIRYDRPPTFPNSSKAKTAVGFIPIIPNMLPMGFVLQEIQLNKTQQWRSLAMRITDGLVKATVYQWRASNESNDVSSLEDSSSVDYHGVRLMLVSDLREPLRKKILEAFVNSAETENVWMRSLGRLTPSVDPFGDDQMGDTNGWELNQVPEMFSHKEPMILISTRSGMR